MENLMQQRRWLNHGVNANDVAMLTGSEASACGLPMLRITPLCGALARHHANVAQLLIQHGAQYDIFTAAFLGDLEGVQSLLDQAPELVNADDPACDLAQITPLMHAVMTDQFEVAQLLLERGAIVGGNSIRLVRHAANHGNEALTELLLQHGADPTTIGAGIWVVYPSIAEKLITRGANVNQEPGKWIGLCCTGNSGHKENPALAQGLLRCGADVTALYKGTTALHCASRAGFTQVVKALIEHGASVSAFDANGQTPLDALETAGKSVDREPVRRLLVAHGARQS
ncbi:MAG: ankyrin repeat domain-containing protein [Armatimonas sp.]